jgi:hypothetical protein
MNITTYFGFGIAPSMFPLSCTIVKRELSPEQAKEEIEKGVTPCLNPSHKASIDAMGSRFGIAVAIPEKAPQVVLKVGDRLIVMGVLGLPRLENRHEYTTEEVANAKFAFSLWEVS